MGLDRPDEAGARRRHGPAPQSRRIRRARRRQCGRPDGVAGATALAGRPGGDVTLDIALHRTAAPRLRPHRLRRRLSTSSASGFRSWPSTSRRGSAGGTAGGWNCHQFHANSEFYADYGTLRRAHHGAGALRRRRDGAASGLDAATRRQRHAAATCRTTSTTSAWTADPRFVEVNDRFSATRDVTEAEYASAAALVGSPARRDAPHRRQHPPADATRAHAAGRALLEAPRPAIKHFGLWYGRYPYPTLTVVDPAYGGLGSGGMEYPTFITGGTSHAPEPLAVRPGARSPRRSRCTSTATSIWYGLVGSNEFEEAWLDEGFNSYSTGRLVDRPLRARARPWAPCSGFASVTRRSAAGRIALFGSFDRTATARVDVLARIVWLLQLRPDRT